MRYLPEVGSRAEHEKWPRGQEETRTGQDKTAVTSVHPEMIDFWMALSVPMNRDDPHSATRLSFNGFF